MPIVPESILMKILRANTKAQNSNNMGKIIRTKVAYVNATKINWTTEIDHDEDFGAYPGDEKMVIGCLMRIANSLEKVDAKLEIMQQPYAQLKANVIALDRGLSEKMTEVHSLKDERKKIKGLLTHFKGQTTIGQQEITRLKELLKQHNINF